MERRGKMGRVRRRRSEKGIGGGGREDPSTTSDAREFTTHTHTYTHALVHSR